MEKIYIPCSECGQEIVARCYAEHLAWERLAGELLIPELGEDCDE